MICKPFATVTAGSSLPIELRFYAEGESQTPTAVVYTLSDEDHTVINEKDDEPITPVSSTMNFMIEGDDLPNDSYETVPIYLEVKYTYDSSTYGTGKEVVEQETLYIKPLNYQS